MSRDSMSPSKELLNQYDIIAKIENGDTYLIPTTDSDDADKITLTKFMQSLITLENNINNEDAYLTLSSIIENEPADFWLNTIMIQHDERTGVTPILFMLVATCIHLDMHEKIFHLTRLAIKEAPPEALSMRMTRNSKVTDNDSALLILTASFAVNPPNEKMNELILQACNKALPEAYNIPAEIKAQKSNTPHHPLRNLVAALSSNPDNDLTQALIFEAIDKASPENWIIYTSDTTNNALNMLVATLNKHPNNNRLQMMTAKLLAYNEIPISYWTHTSPRIFSQLIEAFSLCNPNETTLQLMQNLGKRLTAIQDLPLAAGDLNETIKLLFRYPESETIKNMTLMILKKALPFGWFKNVSPIVLNLTRHSETPLSKLFNQIKQSDDDKLACALINHIKEKIIPHNDFKLNGSLLTKIISTLFKRQNDNILQTLTPIIFKHASIQNWSEKLSLTNDENTSALSIFFNNLKFCDNPTFSDNILHRFSQDIISQKKEAILETHLTDIAEVFIKHPKNPSCQKLALLALNHNPISLWLKKPVEQDAPLTGILKALQLSDKSDLNKQIYTAIFKKFDMEIWIRELKPHEKEAQTQKTLTQLISYTLLDTEGPKSIGISIEPVTPANIITAAILEHPQKLNTNMIDAIKSVIKNMSDTWLLAPTLIENTDPKPCIHYLAKIIYQLNQETTTHLVELSDTILQMLIKNMRKLNIDDFELAGANNITTDLITLLLPKADSNQQITTLLDVAIQKTPNQQLHQLLENISSLKNEKNTPLFTKINERLEKMAAAESRRIQEKERQQQAAEKQRLANELKRKEQERLRQDAEKQKRQAQEKRQHEREQQRQRQKEEAEKLRAQKEQERKSEELAALQKASHTQDKEQPKESSTLQSRVLRPPMAVCEQYHPQPMITQTVHQFFPRPSILSAATGASQRTSTNNNSGKLSYHRFLARSSQLGYAFYGDLANMEKPNPSNARRK